MSRPHRSIAIVLALLAQMILTPSHAAAAYYGFCGIQTFQKSFTVIDRTGYTNITGALMDVDLRTLTPCTETYNPTLQLYFNDQPFVLASIQGSGSIVQIGYGKCGKAGGCNGVPNDGKVHFLHTRLDTEAGRVYLADNWYKAPVLGHRYRMKVEATTHSGNAVWQYCIRDITNNEAYECVFYTRTWTNGTWAWWGTETGDKNSANGNRTIDPDIDLIGQYKRSGQWFQRQDATNVCKKFVLNPDEGETHPSWYACTVLGDQATLWSYTNDH